MKLGKILFSYTLFFLTILISLILLEGNFTSQSSIAIAGQNSKHNLISNNADFPLINSKESTLPLPTSPAGQYPSTTVFALPR